MKAPNKLFIKPEQIKVEMIPGGELPNVGIQYIRKEALLEWAGNMYEKTMTFVSGDSERDNEIQKFALRIVKHIESL